jgi:N-methylhydantoinase A
VTLRAGYDPRDFVLMAYGGAGATHAHQYAEVAGIGTVVIPSTGPAHSAFGTVTGDRHRSFSLAIGQHAPARFTKASDHVDPSVLNRGFDQIENRAKEALGEGVSIHRYIGMRFRQQVHEIGIPAPAGVLQAGDVDALVDAFEAEYERIYGKNTALRVSGVEFTVVRVEATSPVIRPTPRHVDAAGRSNKPCGRRQVYFFGTDFVDADIYRSEDVGPGHAIAGPAIVERPDTTIVVGPGQVAEMEPYGNFLIRIQPSH